MTLSISDFPTPFYYDLLKTTTSKPENDNFGQKNFTLAEVKKRILSVNIYFEDLVFTNIDELPARNLDALIADVGG